MHSFWAILHYIQDYELKFSTQTNFDTLNSNLKSFFSAKIHMFVDSESQITLFWVDITNIVYVFII